MIVAWTGERTPAPVSPPRGSMPPAKRQVRTIDRLRAVRERALRMSATGHLQAPEKPASSRAIAAQAQPRARASQLGARAQAAAACAKSMLEIVGASPQDGSVDDGLNQAADPVTALAPKGKDSVASAGGRPMSR
jgi:hypothetical protein